MCCTRAYTTRTFFCRFHMTASRHMFGFFLHTNLCVQLKTKTGAMNMRGINWYLSHWLLMAAIYTLRDDYYNKRIVWCHQFIVSCKWYNGTTILIFCGCFYKRALTPGKRWWFCLWRSRWFIWFVAFNAMTTINELIVCDTLRAKMCA